MSKKLFNFMGVTRQALDDKGRRGAIETLEQIVITFRRLERDLDRKLKLFERKAGNVEMWRAARDVMREDRKRYINAVSRAKKAIAVLRRRGPR